MRIRDPSASLSTNFSFVRAARLGIRNSPLTGPLGANGLYRVWLLVVSETDDEDEVSSSGKRWCECSSPIAWRMCVGAVSQNYKTDKMNGPKENMR